MPDASLAAHPQSDPDMRARDDTWWRQVASYYPDSPAPIVNLEHGYFGAMAAPVQAAYDDGVRHVNEHLSPFARTAFVHEHVERLRLQVAGLINAEPDEILLTRSATESMQVLIGQYRGLQPGDSVLYCNLDYPAMRYAMAWLGQRRGVTPVELQFELPLSGDTLLARYAAALRDTPNLKVMLLSHVWPSNGQLLPVQELIALARQHGVDVLLDSAHALGQVPLDVQALQVDFAGFNLHKWIGAPLGLGFVYIRKGALANIEPHFGDRDFPADDIRARLHGGTPPMGAVLAVPAALLFHAQVGGAVAKRARLLWLRQYWTARALQIDGVRLLSPTDAADGTALVAFAVDGMSAAALQTALLERFGIFTIGRDLGYTQVVRATVAITTRTSELDQLVAALATLAAEAK